MELMLVKPSIILEREYEEYIKEWEEVGEKIVPYASRRHKDDFLQLLNHWQISETDLVREKALVPASLYFLVDKDNKIYGAIDLRHDLNEYLLKVGGHIGYGIRPSQRRKGYATKILSLGIEEAKKLNLKKVLVTCNKDNFGSAGAIKNNGGILENEFKEENGNIVQRYWINITL